MSAYSIWPFFVCLTAVLLIIMMPAFTGADAPPNQHAGRLATLDGLRGFLALAVFFNHAALYHDFLPTGLWKPPPSQFYVLLGQVGVAVFFMITGYLFWSRMIVERGQPDWVKFYVGRLFRVGPLYLLAVLIMLAIVLARTGLQPRVPALELTGQVGAWLMLGIAPECDVNGYDGTSLILAGVTWTLRYEWMFYFTLPVAALAARTAWMHLPFTLIGLASCLLYVSRDAMISHISVLFSSFFLFGMTCASLQARGFGSRMPNWSASVLVLLLLTTLFAVFPSANKVVPALLMGLVFYLITSGCSVFGLLCSRVAQRLGDVSYGIYLLQGLVLTIVFSFGPARTLALASPILHWSIMLSCAVLLVVAAACTHTWIERTGIQVGKRVGMSLRARAAHRSASGPALSPSHDRL